MADIETLNQMIGALRALGDSSFATRVAARLAPKLEEALKKTAKAHQAPDGTPWQIKKDGTTPLPNAAEHVNVRARGKIVRATLTGNEVWSQYGAGIPTRPVIPNKDNLPKPIEEMLIEEAAKEFQKVCRGGK